MTDGEELFAGRKETAVHMPMKVSVIMPTYNQCGFIRRALLSLTKQTYTDWELILVNDGCTDETEAFFGEQYIQFGSDGQYIEVGIDGFGSEGEIDIIKRKWAQSGNTITISGNGVPTTTMEITKLTDTDLTLVTLGIPMSYKRVADSEIEKYLN